MKKHYYLLGIAAISLLLFGGLTSPIGAQSEEDEGPGPMPGSYDVDLDISLENIWDYGPHSSSPSGLVNTNLHYNLTKMISPLDEYFNIGFFTPEGDSGSGPIPSFAIDGTFEGSELFVKIINDQDPAEGERMIDWQSALILKNTITVSWMLEEAGSAAQDDTDGPPFPIELLPENFTIPSGSATPALPVVRTPANFSRFFDINEIARNYGYEGLPFVGPSVFFIDNIYDAYEFWENEINISETFPTSEDPENNHTITKATQYDGSSFNLTLTAEFFNTTNGYDHGNFTIWANWDSTGLLQMFSAELFPDMDKDGILEGNERIFFFFELESTDQFPIPVSIGDQGEYILNIDFMANVVLDNKTEEEFVNDVLDSIEAAFIELNGIHLLNYTIDALDGLYYHVDGYVFDLGMFMKDRLGFLFDSSSPGGFGAEEPLPPINAYYMPISEMSGGDHRQGYSDFAINMFDVTPCMNSTLFYDGRSDMWADNSSYLPLYHHPGIVNAWVFNNNDWWNTWASEESFMDHFNDMKPNAIHDGPVSYIEKEDTWFDGYEWHTDTFIDAWIINTSAPFSISELYYVVLEVKELPETDYTTYTPSKPWYMALFGGSNEPMFTGFGSQDIYEEQSGFPIPIDPSNIIPMPARTPDWDIVGGTAAFIESIVNQIEPVITSPEYIDFLETSVIETGDPGDMVDITSFDFGLDWIENISDAGLEADFLLDMAQADNDTGEELLVEMDIYVDSSIEYFWTLSGSFDTLGTYSTISVDIGVTDYHIEPEDTTTTTTTQDDGGIAPGFEFFFGISALGILPIIYKKRR